MFEQMCCSCNCTCSEDCSCPSSCEDSQSAFFCAHLGRPRDFSRRRDFSVASVNYLPRQRPKAPKTASHSSVSLVLFHHCKKLRAATIDRRPMLSRCSSSRRSSQALLQLCGRLPGYSTLLRVAGLCAHIPLKLDLKFGSSSGSCMAFGTDGQWII